MLKKENNSKNEYNLIKHHQLYQYCQTYKIKVTLLIELMQKSEV